MVFQWKEGARFGIDAQVAGDELERIRQTSGGVLVPRSIVEASRPADARLHGFFDWDVHKAAQAHWEEQARLIMRCIVEVRVTPASKEPVRVQAYIHVHDKQAGPCYMSAASVMSDEDLRKQAIADALALLNGLRKRYAHLTELKSIFAELDRVINRMEGKKKKATAKV
jgi:hypothetical protein